MNVVVEVIAEYLLSNRRLVVPAFGAFMVKESGERLFSELLRTDDGVLASLLRDKGLNEMEAAVMIDRFIFEVRHELEAYGYCRLGEVGTLRVEPETGVWRLLPPVHGEVESKHTPYIPEPIVEEEIEEEVESVATVEDEVEDSATQLEIPMEPQPEVQPESQPEVQVETQPEVQPKAQPKAQPRPKMQPRPKAKRKSHKRVDWVIVSAIVVLAVALAVVAYGWYVSSLNVIDTSADDAAMSELRIQLDNDLEKK